MKVMKIFIGILLLLAFNTSLSAQYNLNNLGVNDSDYKVDDSRLQINNKLALLLGNLSAYAYDNFTDYSLADFKQFATDNGFSSSYIHLNQTNIFTPNDNAYLLLLNKKIMIDGVSKELVIIAVRGTKSWLLDLNDIATDLNLRFVSFTQNSDVKVHSGFNNILSLIEKNESIIKFADGQSLAQKISNQNTIFTLTGHSLGGAVATLYGASLRERGKAITDVQVYTFGAAAPGAASFLNRYGIYAPKWLIHYRVVNNKDIVAHLNTLQYTMVNQGFSMYYNESGDLSSSTIYCSGYKTLGFDKVTSDVADWYSDKEACSLSDHLMANYQSKLYSNLDIDYYASLIQDDGNVSITFSDDELLLMEGLIDNNRSYQKAVATGKFDATKLTKAELSQLRYGISKLGINFSNKNFGALGEALSTKTQAIANIGKTNAAQYFSLVQDKTELQAVDYERFAFGSAMNSAGAVADIFGIGAASKAMKAIPVITKFYDVLKLAKYHTILSKAPKALVKSVELLGSKKFLFLKTLIEARFVMNTQLEGMITDDASTAEMVGLVVGASGDITKEIITKNKNKFIGLFVGILDNIVTGIVKEGAKVAIEDETLKAAYDALMTALPEFIPYAGSFVSEWRLGEKISDNRSNSAEAQQAWVDYNNITESTIQKIRYLSELGIAKKLNFIMNAYIKQINIYNHREEARLVAIKKANEALFSRLLPISDTKIGDKIAIYFGKDVEYRDEIIKASTLGLIYRLSYQVEGEAFKVVDATYDASLGALVFQSPTDKPYTLYKVSIPKAPYTSTDTSLRFNTFQLPVGNTGVSAENLDANTVVVNDSNTTQECPVGATDIACKVGPHIANIIGTNVTAFKISGNYTYSVEQKRNGYVLVIRDIKNPLFPVTISDTFNMGNCHSMNIVGNYIYAVRYLDEKQNIIIDVSKPEKPILIDTNSDSHFFSNQVIVDGNYVYENSHTKINIVDISNPKSPKIVSTIGTEGYYKDFYIKDNYLIIAETHGVQIIDISDKKNPFVDNIFDFKEDIVQGLYVSKNMAYVSTNNDIQILDITNPKILNKKSTINIGDFNIETLLVSENYLYAAGKYGMRIYDVSNIELPNLMNELNIETFSVYGIIKGYIIGLEHYDYKKIIVVDISNPFGEKTTEQIAMPHGISHSDIDNNYLYLAPEFNNGSRYVQVFDITEPLAPVQKTSLLSINDRPYASPAYVVDAAAKDNIVYVLNRSDIYELSIFDTSNKDEPKLVSKINLGSIYDISFSHIIVDGKHAYIMGDKFLIVDISTPDNPTLVSTLNIRFNAFDISGKYLYASSGNKLSIIDISDAKVPVTISNYQSNNSILNIKVRDNYMYTTDLYSFNIINISDKLNPELEGSFYNYVGSDIDIGENYAFVSNTNGSSALNIFDVSNSSNLSLIKSFYYPEAYAVKINGDYVYLSLGNKLKIINWKKIIENKKIINLYYEQKLKVKLRLLSEQSTEIDKYYTKYEWTFDKNISSYDVDIVNDTFNYSKDLIKDGNKISIVSAKDFSKPVNELTLKFKANSIYPTTVNKNNTFGVSVRINNPPRLADGQLTQLLLKNNTGTLDINTFDADGDSVTLSVKNSDGGNVSFNNNVLNASFSDTKSVHTITITLNDGKESVDKKITVLNLTTDTIKTFYSDVNADYSSFKEIAFATLEGIIAGQVDPADATKRIFRPNDYASMAETLAMILKTEKKMGKIDLQSSNYYMKAYPSWVMPYYTYAREHLAIDMIGDDLSIVYPTREEVSKIIVKTLNLEDKLAIFPELNAHFSDEANFSNAAMLRYAQITKAFGLFMTGTVAGPKSKVTRAEMADLITKISMLPNATATVLPASVEYGDDINVTLSDVQAKVIDTNLNLVNATPTVSYVLGGKLFTTATINTSSLKVGDNKMLVVLDNNGVRDFSTANVHVAFSDRDQDGVQDSSDAWPDDARYNVDGNANGIPDILDLIYNLGNLNASDSVTIGNESVNIQSIITNGAYVPTTHNINLNQGWNLVALPIVGTINITDLNNTDIEVIRSFQNGKWYVWTKSNTTTTEQPLTTLTSGYGYWIKASQATSITITGDTQYHLSNIQTSNGWSMLGSLNIPNMTIFFNAYPNITIVWKYKDNQWYSISRDNVINDTLRADNNISELFSIVPSDGIIVK